MSSQTPGFDVPPEARPIEPTGGGGGRALRALLLVLAVLAGIVVAGGMWLRGRLEASLPRLDGEVAVAGLAGPATITRDRVGVVTVEGASREDVAFATGFAHAQDRFFQMDLMRRRAAGELAELFGRPALEWDRSIRVHRFRSVAERALDETKGWGLLEPYTRGVNAGLAALGEVPPEYLVLRRRPEPWRPEDTVLVLLSMFIVLNDEDGSHESALGVLHDVLPATMADFLSPRGTGWDAPVEGAAFETPPIPGPEVVDLRRAEPAPARPDDALSEDAEAAAAGSNNWAVAGELTAHGGAILANDMHLGLSVPNTWYRAQLRFPGPGGDEVVVTGVTLPGAPALVVGSNGHVAWGFTNSYGDFTDLVVLEPDGDDPDRYLTPDGPREVEVHREEIRVQGGPTETLDVLWTIWGPVVDTDHLGRRRALRWTAHEPEALGFRFDDLETARTLEQALDAASRAGIPPQNFACAAADGRIGWTIMGRIPRRVGFSGRLPTSWADGTRRWDGLLPPAETPRIVAPDEGRLWTANARVVGGEMLKVLGDGGYDLGARAGQIRDRLREVERPDEAAMLAIQLDDEARFYERWQRLLLEVLDEGAVAADPRRDDLRRLAETWGGRAAVDSAGFRMVRAFRLYVGERILNALTAPCSKADERFRPGALPQTEGPVWRLVSERPEHLLPPEYASWHELLLAAADRVVEYFTGDGSSLAQHTWGERNTARIRHPLSGGLPALSRFLDMPPDQLAGDDFMPRVQGPTFGASERLAVSPGREAEGYLHMPTGQSGHPLSPFYRAGHEAWVEGRPTPFLPGEGRHSLRLVPAGGGRREAPEAEARRETRDARCRGAWAVRGPDPGGFGKREG